MSSAPPPLQAEYGADEIGAIVLDPGHSVTRAGFAGEDVPKSVVPSYYGSLPDKSHIFDDNAIHNPLPNLDIKNPMAKDSTVEDWDTAAKLWEYSITSRLTGFRQTSALRNGLNDAPQNGEDVEMEDVENNESPLAETPLLMTEPGWNSPKNREKAIEIAMEDWGTPAFYLARSGVMSAFASGKPTALVIDIGASTTGVTAVHDGLILKKGTMKSNLAGNWISDQLRLIFSTKKEFQLTPHYLIQSKTPVDASKPAQALLRQFATPPRESFRKLQEERILTEFKESCVQVWNPQRSGGTNQTLDTARDQLVRDIGKPFEFPNGYNDVFGFDRYRAAESLFDEKQVVTGPNHTTEIARNQTITGMASAALSSVDVDLRAVMLQNVVVSGGSSLIHGMTDRIHYELSNIYPGTRCRIVAPGMIVERKYASWIGGSILASLGSFHQLWISKKEYEENGASVVEKRCK